MNKYFEKRLARVLHPRARKRNKKRPTKFVRPSSNLAAVLYELQHPIDIGRHQRVMPYGGETAATKFCHELGGTIGALTVAAALDGVDAVKYQLGKKERMLKLERRRQYYAAETEKRTAQREQLRLATVEPINPCPTPEALTDAYLHRRDSDECLLRFGMLMIDLEEHAKRNWQITGNKFTGSSGGVKDWLKENCPLLADHYSTCQRYKRLAQEDSDT